jgi:hypothetical protein
MKKIKANIIVKFAAWMLLSFFALVFFISVAGIAVLVHTGAYWDGGRSLRETSVEQVYSFDQMRISYILNEYCKGTITDATEYREMYTPANSNVFFVIKDKGGNVVVDFSSSDEYQQKYEYDITHIIKEGAITEKKEFATLKEAKEYVAQLEENFSVTVWYYSETTKEFEVTYNEEEIYTVNAYIRKDLTAKDRYFYALNLVDFAVSMRYWAIIIVIASFILGFLILIFLCSTAVAKETGQNSKLSFIHRIPFDLYFAFSVFTGIVFMLLFYSHLLWVGHKRARKFLRCRARFRFFGGRKIYQGVERDDCKDIKGTGKGNFLYFRRNGVGQLGAHGGGECEQPRRPSSDYDKNRASGRSSDNGIS